MEKHLQYGVGLAAGKLNFRVDDTSAGAAVSVPVH